MREIMMSIVKRILAGTAFGLALAMSSVSAKAVEIEYWAPLKI